MFDALEWLTAMCSHVPNKGEQMVRYYGYYSNVSRGKHIQDPGLLEEIGMPEDCEIVAPIIVGYPKNIPDLPERMDPQILRVIGN
jgi:hypothetical protein